MDEKKFICPCCGEKTLCFDDEFDICEICGWIDDPLQHDDPDDTEGQNPMSLNEAKSLWAKQQKAV